MRSRGRRGEKRANILLVQKRKRSPLKVGIIFVMHSPLPEPEHRIEVVLFRAWW